MNMRSIKIYASIVWGFIQIWSLDTEYLVWQKWWMSDLFYIEPATELAA